MGSALLQNQSRNLFRASNHQQLHIPGAEKQSCVFYYLLRSTVVDFLREEELE